MKLVLVFGALMYLLGLWSYAGYRRDAFSRDQKVATSASEAVRVAAERFDFARECPDSAGCPSDLDAFLHHVGEQVVEGRRFVWLDATRERLPSYRREDRCETRGDCHPPPVEGSAAARFEIVSACNPRLLACN